MDVEQKESTSNEDTTAEVAKLLEMAKAAAKRVEERGTEKQNAEIALLLEKAKASARKLEQKKIEMEKAAAEKLEESKKKGEIAQLLEKAKASAKKLDQNGPPLMNQASNTESNNPTFATRPHWFDAGISDTASKLMNGEWDT